MNSEIKDGEAQISGSMSFEEADKLASTIRIGGLSLELEELRSNVVGAQLGEEAISTSFKAGAIGLAIVFIFMCVVYLLPGLAASIALLIYTGLILVLLNAFDITLTLPGIAGIILGIGMAVDANVIIFARVREELTTGKSGRQYYNTDCGGSPVAQGKRHCQRFCADAGPGYCGFYVYCACNYPSHRICFLCRGYSQ